MTLLKYGLSVALSVATLTGCGANKYSFDNPSDAEGMTYKQMRAAYEDLGPVEFSIIDVNNDYIVDPAEEADFDIDLDDD